MKKISIILSFLLISLVSCEEKATNVQVVSYEEMETYLDLEDIQLVDVRTPKEYKEGHINQAQNIDFFSPTFDQDIQKLDKDKPVMVYCQMGGRSAKCAERMKELGFVKIYDFKGGYSKWKSQEQTK